MPVIWMVVVGLAVGAIAKLLVTGHEPGGLSVTLGLGIAGALLAGFIGEGFGLFRTGEPVGFFAAVVGAVLLLLVYRVISGRPRS